MIKIIVSILIFSSSIAFALPAQVIIIRHGEKPRDGNELNRQGCERAYSLPKFFTENSIVNEFGRPVTVYAQRPEPDSSIRAAQTIAPTAEALGLKVFDLFSKNETDEMAHEILSNPRNSGKTVLVAWEHKVIVDIAEALGLALAKDYSQWPGEVFDQAWVIRFDNRGNAVLQIIAEFVLPGDNPRGGFKHWQDGPTEPGPTPILQQGIIEKCSDNDQLNKLLGTIAEPAIE